VVDQKTLGTLGVDDATKSIACLEQSQLRVGHRQVKLDRSCQPREATTNDGDAGIRLGTQSTAILMTEQENESSGASHSP
jgi:hypothetical protein